MQFRRNLAQGPKGIQPIKMRCPKSGAVSSFDISGVSIRSALFALKKEGIITDAEFKELNSRWMKHKTKHKLDAYGHKADRQKGDAKGVGSCC